MHELRQVVSLIHTLLQRSWHLPQALRTAWDQVKHHLHFPLACCTFLLSMQVCYMEHLEVLIRLLF